jgi:hypothetical protein
MCAVFRYFIALSIMCDFVGCPRFAEAVASDRGSAWHHQIEQLRP